MIDEATLAQINGPYVCPPDAGPAWRAACEYGFDMSLVETALEMTPEQRLDEHQRFLDMILEIEAARQINRPNNNRAQSKPAAFSQTEANDHGAR